MRKKNQRKIEHEQDVQREEGQQVDARVLGQILAAQNVIFALPDATRIAEFYSQTLLSIPGIAACRVCLANQSIQAGQMENTPCAACEASRRDGNPGSIVPADPNFNCNLINQPDVRVIAIDSYQHHFGFFSFNVDQTADFDAYQPFIKNLSNYVALIFENRLQENLLQAAQHGLERRVEERTRDLTIANEELQREIAERQRTEKALRESEGQVRQLFDASPVAMILSQGRNEHVEWINNKFIELFGYTIEDMPDVEHWWSLAYQEEAYREEVKRRWSEDVEQAIRNKGHIKPMEAKVRCRNGSYRYIEFRLSSIGEKHLVTFVDLTERKQAEIALHERERHSQSLLRLSRKLEQVQIYSDVLNAAQDEVREIIGYQNLWAYLITEDKKYAHAMFASGPIRDMVMTEDGAATLVIDGDPMLEAIASAQEIVVIEDAQVDKRVNNEIVTRLGNRTIVNVPIVLFDRHMGSVGTGTFGDEGIRVPTAAEREYLVALASHMAVALDRIHLLDQRRQSEQALRENEEKFRTLIEQSAEGVMLADENGAIVEWNLANEKMMGLARDQVLGQPLWDIMIKLIAPERATDERRESIKSGILEALRNGRSYLFDVPIEMEFYPLPGREKRYFHQIIFPIKTERGYRIASLIEDVTERKQMTEALAAQEREFRTLAENSPDNVARYDIDCRTIYVNPTLEKTLGRPMSEMLGTFPAEAGFINEAKEYQEKMVEVLKTGKAQEMDLVLPDIGEGVRYHNIRFIAERGADGAITGIQAIGRDITERKKAESKLLASEQLFRALVENSPDFIARYDREFRRIYINPAIQKLFGVPAQNVLGKTPSDQSPVYAPQIYIDHLRQVIETAMETAVEMPYRTAHGEMHWGHMRFVPEFGSDGKVDSVLAIGRDIHEIKENEQRFRMLAENFPDLVMRFDRDGRYIYVNPAFEKTFGMPAESVVGKLPHHIKGKENSASLARIRRAFEEGAANETEVHWDTETGERIFENRYIPEKDATGNVVTVLCIARDLTERKRAENALRESEEKYRLLHEHAGIGIGYYKPDGQVISYNHLAASHMGGKPEDFEGRLIYEIFPREEADFYMERIRSTLVAHSALYYEDHLQLPSGEKWFLSIFTKICDAQQNVIGVQIMSQDFTERKKAEEDLRASENRFRVLSENAFVGIYIIQDGRLSYVNSTLAEIFGYTPEELTGAQPALVIHPDDQALVSENIRRRIVGEIENIHYEFRGRCKNGEIKNIEVLGGRTDLGGQPAIIGNLMDITDRKRTEEEIARSLTAEKKARRVAEILRDANESLSRTLHLDNVLQNLLDYLMNLVPYDSANVMLREGDFHFRVVALRGYERWTDLDAAQKLVFDIRTIPSLNELVAAQKSTIIVNTYEYPGWQRVPGTEHVVSWMGIPIIVDGQVIGLYSVDKVKPAFFTDEHRFLAEGLAAQAAVAIQNTRLHDQITRSNVELEQRVASRTAQLEEANKELEAFAYSVSHDLRAPLRHIDGFIELLQKRMKTVLDDKSQHYMDVIADSARKMGTLIDDLLSFSRMGRKEMFASRVDLNDLIQDIVHESKPETQGRSIQWKISSLPPVTGDQAMLRIVLVNLIANALKFTRSRKVAQIEIGYEDNENETVIFVHDNGVGFDMRYVDKLFGVFQRLHRQEDFEGTGIGLANVRRIISRHGGRTWAEGKLNGGATFYFSLPYISVAR